MQLFQRVKQVAQAIAGSETKLAEKISLPQRKFNGYLNPISEKNLWQYLHLILEVYPDVRREWLYFGEGEMLREQEQLGENVDASALRQRIVDLGKIVAAQEKTIAAQEEMIRVYKERERFPTATGAPTPTSAVLSQAPNSSEE
jgi:hypothetical protein